MKILLNRKRLARILAAKSISQNHWAQRLGLDKGHLSQLVNGKRGYPSAHTRQKLMQGLGADYDELFEIELPQRDKPQLLSRMPGDTGRMTPGWGRIELEREKPTMATWTRELMIALRVFRRAPGFAAAVTLVLALALGANSALFSVLDAVVLRPLPYQNAERLFLLFQADRHRGTEREGFSVPDLLDLRERSETFQRPSGI